MPGRGRPSRLESHHPMGGSTVLKLAEVTTVVPVSKQMTTSDPLVWIDCEMTGLDQSADALIGVAVVVTDYELKP